MNRKKYLRNGLIATGLAFLMLMSSSIAYFSDYAISRTKATAGSVNISVDNKINLLNEDGKDILNPGDVRDVKFQVQNEGNKSVDTEVVITLISSVPMSDMLGAPTISSLSINDGASTFGLDNNLSPSKKLYDQDVYSSEYELYWAKDIVEVDGYGHYPVQNAEPVQMRTISSSKDKIVYILSDNTLSGNGSLDEREIEWKTDTSYLNNCVTLGTDDYSLYYEDFSDYIPGIGVISQVNVDKNMGNDNRTVIIPAELEVNHGDYYGEIVPVEYLWLHALQDSEVKSLYVSPSLKGIMGYNDNDEMVIFSVEEVESLYGISVSYYDDYNEFVNGKVLSDIEYQELTDAEREEYVKCSDSKAYELALLFDPNSGNSFQASNVCIEVEVRAKQHRNTSSDWELVDTLLESVIQDSIFTVEYDNMRRVVLKDIAIDINEFMALKEITIPEGVEVIPEQFFYGCENLETVNLPSTLVEIEYGAFNGCANLKTVNMSEGIEFIGECAFAECSSLESINLPNSLKIIEASAFENCSSLKSVTIPNSLYTSYDASNWSYLSEYCFRNCTGLETVTFADGATTVPYEAFANCPNLKTVNLPNTITEIQEGAFYGCGSLEQITLPENLKTIGNYAFYMTGLTRIVLPNSVTDLGYCSFAYCEALEEVRLSKNIKVIGEETFKNCTALTNIQMHGNLIKNTIAGSITDIEGNAFRGCTSLPQITIGDNVKSISYNVFYGCTNMTKAVIGESVEVIGSLAFYDCPKLTEITFKTNVLGELYNRTFAVKDSTPTVNTTVYVNSDRMENMMKLHGWGSSRRSTTIIHTN